MGQSVVALMYGVKRSDLDDDLRRDGEWPWDSLRWEEQPRTAYEGDAVGFPIAVSGGGNRDEGDLGETCFLSEVADVHAIEVRIARNKWEKFSAWFKANCKGKLPKAGLLLTRDERA